MGCNDFTIATDHEPLTKMPHHRVEEDRVEAFISAAIHRDTESIWITLPLKLHWYDCSPIWIRRAPHLFTKLFLLIRCPN